MQKPILSLILLYLALAGCTNRQGFDGLKAQKLNDCYRQPLSTQQQCIQEVQALDYHAYQREREQVLEEQAK